MIAGGFKLLVHPGRYWEGVMGDPRAHTPAWSLGASFEAAMFAAMAAVAGQIGAALLQLETTDVAIQRAAVGLLSTFLGALVMTPAMALALMWISARTAAPMDSRFALANALGFVRPSWALGVLLALPPLLGAGPEPGEIIWLILATIGTVRILNSSAITAMGIRRRWVRVFRWRCALTFVALFVLIPLAPAFVARSLLQVDAIAVFISGSPDVSWPLPPLPQW